jgi:hypothetical protein
MPSDGMNLPQPVPPPEAPASPIRVVVHRGSAVHHWQVAADALPLDESRGSPWLFIPPPARAAFDALSDAGIPLGQTPFRQPLLGVKCGCNDAFIVLAPEGGGDLVEVRAGAKGVPMRHGMVERALLRPLVRGETLASWRVAVREWILWTHGEPVGGSDEPLQELPPHAARWLAPWRHRLAARTDTRGRGPWWALFRTESAQATAARVVWSDFGRAPRAIVLDIGDPVVPLNSCYVASCPSLLDAHGLAALLNGPLAAAWLNVVAEPARGGYRRYLGWTVSLLPIPRDWARVRAALAPLSERATGGAKVSRAELCEAAATAYGVSLASLAPLLAWADS